jgi:hypothetical protein
MPVHSEWNMETLKASFVTFVDYFCMLTFLNTFVTTTEFLRSIALKYTINAKVHLESRRKLKYSTSLTEIKMAAT